MDSKSDELAEKIQSLPDAEKLDLVDSIMTQLDKPDPEIDRIWAEEAQKRWKAYKSGELKTASYDEVMSRYREK
tara:strand:+ start:260 stop:481 length:222 start_codon:yes stop_codon:yes gene_type:complete